MIRRWGMRLNVFLFIIKEIFIYRNKFDLNFAHGVALKVTRVPERQEKRRKYFLP
jgi:hypothetical protein